jgi:CelD/BcsL family acetyltransferase involved in cellulose biosynthesis
VAGCEAAVCTATVQYWVSHEDEWDVLDLHCLPAASLTRKVLPALFGQHGYGVREVVEEECPILILPQTWEEYLGGLSSKQRHELRRKMRRAGDVAAPEIERITSEPELPDALEAFFSLHRQAGREKEAFLTPQVREFFGAFTRSFFEAGWLDLCFLVAGGKRVASLLCFDWNDGLYVYNSGYDPQYASLSVGIALLGRSIQDAIARGNKRVDFLRGREQYKFQLGAQAFPIYRLTLHKGMVPQDLG